jgi:hypothetical protein
MNKDDLRREIDDRTKEWGEHYEAGASDSILNRVAEQIAVLWRHLARLTTGR